MKKEQLKLSFFGGTGIVTGANFLLENMPLSEEEKKTRILVDCGLIQSGKFCEGLNEEDFKYDPTTIDVLLVTHAHIDHTGRIPKLVKDGFKGVIYSTPETKEIARLMLEDGLNIMSGEARKCQTEPLYSMKDIEDTFSMWKTIPYHKNIDVSGGFNMFLKDAGHILGSSIIELSYKGTKVVSTGDLGNSPAPLLRNVEDITDADYLIMESVYGDRVHEERKDRKQKLERIIKDVIRRGGTLVIPAFSLERTQELLYELDNMSREGKIPKIPVFLDSPLAIKITEIYKRSELHFNEKTKKIMSSGEDIFNFPGLTMTESVEESKAIFSKPNPKIIIAGSGMSNGGRIIHHEKRYLPDPSSTMLIFGYQAAGSLGRKILDRSNNINIFGKKIRVKAQVEELFSYSSHMDGEGLINFAEKTSESVKKVFVVMGEPKASLFLAQRLRDYLGVNAVTPKLNESILLDVK